MSLTMWEGPSVNQSGGKCVLLRCAEVWWPRQAVLKPAVQVDGISWGRSMIKLPLDPLKMTSSVLSNLHHGKQFLNTKDTPLVLATDWQLGKCGSSLSSSIICTTDSDKFLFQTEEATTYPTHLKRAVRRCTLKWSAMQGGRRDPGWNQQFHDQPSSLCGCTVFPGLSLPLLLIYKIVF